MRETLGTIYAACKALDIDEWAGKSTRRKVRVLEAIRDREMRQLYAQTGIRLAIDVREPDKIDVEWTMAFINDRMTRMRKEEEVFGDQFDS